MRDRKSRSRSVVPVPLSRRATGLVDVLQRHDREVIRQFTPVEWVGQ